MAITTHAQLLTAISTWLDDNQYTANASDFVTLGENRIRRELRVSQMEARATASTSTSTRFLSLPTGFIAFRRLQLNTSTISNLEYCSQDQMELFRQSTAGQPRKYTITDEQIEFDRVSDSVYTAEMQYYKLTDLVATTQETNEIFPEFADLYMYAALSEGATFLQEDASVLENKYQLALFRAHRADTFRKYPEGKLRVRLDFIPE